MKNIFKFATILCTGLMFGACTDDIVVDNVDEGAYANVENLIISLRDGKSSKINNVVELRNNE